MIQKRNTAFPDHIYMRKMNKNPIQLKCVNKDNWKLSLCLCFDFHYICVHIIGLAIRLKLVDPPVHVVDFAFTKKPKR